MGRKKEIFLLHRIKASGIKLEYFFIRNFDKIDLKSTKNQSQNGRFFINFSDIWKIFFLKEKNQELGSYGFSSHHSSSLRDDKVLLHLFLHFRPLGSRQLVNAPFTRIRVKNFPLTSQRAYFLPPHYVIEKTSSARKMKSLLHRPHEVTSSGKIVDNN